MISYCIMSKNFGLKSSRHSRVCKRRWSDNCPESGENDSKTREETGSFHVQSGRGRKRVNSMVVEEETTSVQE
ncbi:hypothetical protein TNCV_2689831 [Trichonephila clavipes]|uniref:Uncharacterized protein n=1 Tax=Trichonephila clavipes TaxID=2585209 RepID=A0A8X6VYL2_TRICX|nr:hypothetical protein TNCV_2689831 [Trichonephila clavipes]